MKWVLLLLLLVGCAEPQTVYWTEAGEPILVVSPPKVDTTGMRLENMTREYWKFNIGYHSQDGWVRQSWKGMDGSERVEGATLDEVLP